MNNSNKNNNSKIPNKNISLKQSFSFAFKGLINIYKMERNFRIQSIVGITVLIVSLFCNLSTIEFIFLLFTVMLVLVMETLNTVVEKLLDFIHPIYNSTIKTIKDISAALVLITSVFAVVIGIIIFGRALFNLHSKYGIIIAIIFLLILNLLGALYKTDD